MKTLMLTIVACAALAITGCGGGDDDSSTDSTGSSEATTAEAPAKKTKPKVSLPSGAPPAGAAAAVSWLFRPNWPTAKMATLRRSLRTKRLFS